MVLEQDREFESQELDHVEWKIVGVQQWVPLLSRGQLLEYTFVGCDFECHKKFWLSSLDTNWFSNEMVKDPI
jgi:hypothetical protein